LFATECYNLRAFLYLVNIQVRMFNRRVVRSVGILWIFLSCFFLLGTALVLLATASFGPGISGDAVDYLSTADNLARGRGFIDYAGDPYLYWPPLYPILLAAPRWLAGVDTLVTGRLLNALSFGLVVALTALLFRRTFPDEPLWMPIGGLTALCSISLLRLAANIDSDVLFILLVLVYALLASSYLETRHPGDLWGMTLVSGLAAVLRWSGVVLVATMVVSVLIAGRANFKLALRSSLFFGALASLPFTVWVVGRNYLLLGTFLGARRVKGILVMENLNDSLSRMSHWLLPRLLTDRITFWAFLVLGLIFLLLLNRGSDWNRFIRRLVSPTYIPYWIFTAIYLVFILLTTLSADHPGFYDDRYQAPLYPFVMLFLGLVADELIMPHLRRMKMLQGWRLPVARIVLLGGFCIWLLFPAFGVYKYVLVSQAVGDTSYNLYNTPAFRNSQLVSFLMNMEFEPGTKLYSNYPAAAYYFLRRETLHSPNTPMSRRPDEKYLKENYADWPATEKAYVIWFKPNNWNDYFKPRDLKPVAEMTPIYKSLDGDVWLAEKMASSK
jgi:4-amino-4-deoxy-L-arabinose transferase-like glycosyltransferase